MSPRFSVIVPTYNNAATLARALDSVLAQRFEAHEIIVVDDGSTDHTALVVAPYKDRIRYLRQENAGVSAARNFGVSMATGDWIAFLDADDEYLPDRLLAHAEWIVDEPEIDFLLADQMACEPDGKPIGRFMARTRSGKDLLARYPDRDRIPLGPADFGLLVDDGFAETRTISVRRQMFQELGGFPVQHAIGEDAHLFIRVFARSKSGGVTPKSLALYYIYGTSALRKDRLEAMRQFITTLDSLAEELADASRSIRAGIAQKRRHTRLSLAYAYLRAGKKWPAIRLAAQNVKQTPSLSTVRELLSVVRGFKA